jgi:hypothetical protein
LNKSQRRFEDKTNENSKMKVLDMSGKTIASVSVNPHKLSIDVNFSETTLTKYMGRGTSECF